MQRLWKDVFLYPNAFKTFYGDSYFCFDVKEVYLVKNVEKEQKSTSPHVIQQWNCDGVNANMNELFCWRIGFIIDFDRRKKLYKNYKFFIAIKAYLLAYVVPFNHLLFLGYQYYFPTELFLLSSDLMINCSV